MRWSVSRQAPCIIPLICLFAQQMSQFNTSLPKAFEYSLNALNLADLLLRRGLNLRLAVNFAQVWADDAQPRPNGHQMLISRLLDYVSGHLYRQEKDATLLLTGNRFSSSNHTMAAVEASVCSSRAVGFVQVLPNPPPKRKSSMA